MPDKIFTSTVTNTVSFISTVKNQTLFTSKIINTASFTSIPSTTIYAPDIPVGRSIEYLNASINGINIAFNLNVFGPSTEYLNGSISDAGISLQWYYPVGNEILHLNASAEKAKIAITQTGVNGVLTSNDSVIPLVYVYVNNTTTGSMMEMATSGSGQLTHYYLLSDYDSSYLSSLDSSYLTNLDCIIT